MHKDKWLRDNVQNIAEPIAMSQSELQSSTSEETILKKVLRKPLNDKPRQAQEGILALHRYGLLLRLPQALHLTCQ